jgi:hypothetical protein
MSKKQKATARAKQDALKNRYSKLAKMPTYKSGMKNGKPIDFANPKTKRGNITSLD